MAVAPSRLRAAGTPRQPTRTSGRPEKEKRHAPLSGLRGMEGKFLARSAEGAWDGCSRPGRGWAPGRSSQPPRTPGYCFCATIPDAVATEPPHDSICPKHTSHRAPEQVLQDHAAAFVSGDPALVACDYADDAVFILPGSVASGKDQIQATYAFFFASAGGRIQLSLKSLTTGANTVLIEYAVDSNHLVVANGVDTFVIHDGLIVAQTAYLGGLAPK